MANLPSWFLIIVNTEERKAQFRAYYYRHHEENREKARARSAQARAARQETPEQAEERRQKNREWYAKKAEEQRAHRRAYQAERRGDEPMPDVAAMTAPQRHQFLTLLIALLCKRRTDQLTKRRDWQHQRYGTKKRKPKQVKPIKLKRVPMTVKERRKKRTAAARLRRQKCPFMRLASALRKRITGAFASQRAGKKPANTTSLIGCTILEASKHIEKQFQPGMSWDNFGRGEGYWNVDHARPIASFNLFDPCQQRLAFHWSNMAPRWSHKNISKGSTWNGRRWRYSDHACVSTLEAPPSCSDKV